MFTLSVFVARSAFQFRIWALVVSNNFISTRGVQKESLSSLRAVEDTILIASVLQD
jgi:hypothetical protein